MQVKPLEGKQTQLQQGKYIMVMGPALIGLESMQATGATVRVRDLTPGEFVSEIPAGTKILTAVA